MSGIKSFTPSFQTQLRQTEAERAVDPPNVKETGETGAADVVNAAIDGYEERGQGGGKHGGHGSQGGGADAQEQTALLIAKVVQGIGDDDADRAATAIDQGLQPKGGGATLRGVTTGAANPSAQVSAGGANPSAQIEFQVPADLQAEYDSVKAQVDSGVGGHRGRNLRRRLDDLERRMTQESLGAEYERLSGERAEVAGRLERNSAGHTGRNNRRRLEGLDAQLRELNPDYRPGEPAVTTGGANPSAQVSTGGANPSAQVTTGGANPSAQVTTGGANPSAQVTTGGANPSAQVTTGGANPSAQVTTGGANPSAQVTTGGANPSAQVTTGGANPSAQVANEPLDDSSGAALGALPEKGEIGGADFERAILDGTRDLDSQAAGAEFEDIEGYAFDNWDRMSPDAREKFRTYQRYALDAQSEGRTGIRRSDYRRMQDDLGAAGYRDEGAGRAIETMMPGPDGEASTITGPQMRDAIIAGTEDRDDSAAGAEYADFKDFATDNWDRMSPDAQEAFQTYERYATDAQKAGRTGIRDADYDRMTEELNQIGVRDRSAAEALAALPDKGEIDAEQFEQAIIAGTEDLDSQAAGAEFEQIQQYATENWDRMSPDARQRYRTYERYAEQAQGEGRTGIRTSDYERMKGDMAESGYRDAGAAEALEPLQPRPGEQAGPISGEQMEQAILQATEDLDSSAASSEYEDIRRFANENWDRLSPDAREKFRTYEQYAQAAQKEGRTGIRTSDYEAMKKDMAEAGYADQGMASAVERLQDTQGTITGEQMQRAILEGTEDLDSNAAGGEYEDLARFAEQNWDRLSPDAREKFRTYQRYAAEAQARGSDGIRLSDYDRMKAELASTSGYRDASAGAAIEQLKANGGRVDGDAMYRAILEGTADWDGQTAGDEYADFRRFAEENWDNMSYGARRKFQVYEQYARAHQVMGRDGMSDAVYQRMLKDMQVAGSAEHLPFFDARTGRLDAGQLSQQLQGAGMGSRMSRVIAEALSRTVSPEQFFAPFWQAAGGRGTPDLDQMGYGFRPQDHSRLTHEVLRRANLESLGLDAQRVGRRRRANVTTGGANPSAQVSTGGANPSAQVSTGGANPSAQVRFPEAARRRRPIVTGGGANPSAQVTTGGANPSAQVSTGGANPSAQVSTGGANPSAQVTQGGANPSAQVTQGGANPSAQVTQGGANPSAQVSTGPANPSAGVTTGPANPSGQVDGPTGPASGDGTVLELNRGQSRIANQMYGEGAQVRDMPGAGAGQISAGDIIALADGREIRLSREQALEFNQRANMVDNALEHGAPWRFTANRTPKMVDDRGRTLRLDRDADVQPGEEIPTRGGEPNPYWRYVAVEARDANGEPTTSTLLQVRPGVDPAEAVQDLYDNPERYQLDCSTAVRVLNLKSTLDTIGADDFNRHYSPPNAVTGLALHGHYDSSDNREDYGMMDIQAFGAPEVHGGVQEWPPYDPNSADELVPGDWRYFESTGDTTSASQGWNAVYLGRDENGRHQFWKIDGGRGTFTVNDALTNGPSDHLAAIRGSVDMNGLLRADQRPGVD